MKRKATVKKPKPKKQPKRKAVSRKVAPKALIKRKTKSSSRSNVKSKLKKSAKKISVKKPRIKTRAPAYIQPKRIVTKDVPIPFPDSEKVPPYLLRNLVDIFYDFQGQRIQTQLRIGASERGHTLTKEDLSIYGITTILENARNFERDIEKLIAKQLKNHALYTQYLSKITGIGPMLSAGLIAYIDDIEKFKHVSSLWQYCGYGMNRFCPNCKKPTSVEVKYETGKIAKKLHPLESCPVCNEQTIPILQKRTSGYQSNWSDKLKTLAWKASTSFVKQSSVNSKYRKLYEQIKKDERRRHPTKKIVNKKTMYNDGHINNRAMRKVSKIFLAHVWQTWRRQQGLEATEPYAKQLLGHSVVEAFVDK